MTEEQIYRTNLEHFNNQVELALGNSGNTKLQVLRDNPNFNEVQRKYIIEQIKEQNPSVTILIDCLIDIAEEQFKRKFNSFREIEDAIQEREVEQREIKKDENKVTALKKYTNSKSESRKNKPENIAIYQIGIRQKFANYLANKIILRKIPFIDRFVKKEQRLLPEKEQEKKVDMKTAHSKFEDELSEYGKYKKLILGKPVRDFSNEINIQKIPESYSIADSEKIAEAKKKNNEKSFNDD